MSLQKVTTVIRLLSLLDKCNQTRCVYYNYYYYDYYYMYVLYF